MEPATLPLPQTAAANIVPTLKGLATKAPQGPATIVIRSEPALALSIDGTDAGNGSASIEVTPGKHTVVGKGMGTSIKRIVNVKAGATESVNLVMQKGSLAIEGPPGCDVFVDGTRVGKTPLDPISLVQGSHNIVVKQGAVEYRRSVPIQPNQEMFLQVQFHSN